MFQENPLLGIGPRGFRHVYEQYAGPDDHWLQNGHRGQTHPHSNIVEVLVETGLLGLTGYLLFYSYFFFSLKEITIVGSVLRPNSFSFDKG